MNKKPVNANPTKEFFSLIKTIEKNTKNQARISSYNPDDISSFVIEICPLKGVYQHAKFLFQIQLMMYPREFPNVICLSDIYHPNIEHGEDYHNVCLNLFDNWNRSFGLIDVIQGLIFLLYQPNLNDPISSFFNSKGTNEEIFQRNVFTSLHGGFVDGIEFLPNPGIIEYDEAVKKRSVEEHKVVIAERSGEVEAVITSINTEEKKYKCPEEGGEMAVTMRNNSAAQMCNLDHGEEGVVDLVNGEVQPSEVEEEADENLPTRYIVSPNAFYSDLICSRYSQPDKLSESEYASNNIFFTSMSFDLFEFPLSTYGSPESELCNAFDDYCSDSEDDDDDDDEEDDDDEDIQFVHNDTYISVPFNSEDPSNVFLSKWLEVRRQNHASKDSPEPMTSIVLTNVLNPFRDMIGIFLLCDSQDSNMWRFQEKNVYRIQSNDRTLHLMVWAQNLSRWFMDRHRSFSYSEWGCDQLLWYSLFVGLSSTIHGRLVSRYNYGSNKYSCHYVK